MFHCVVNNHSVQAAHSTIVHTILHSINRLLLSLNWRLFWQFMARKLHNMHSSQEFYTIPWTLLNPGPHNSQESNKTKTCISCDVLLSSHLIEMFFYKTLKLEIFQEFMHHSVKGKECDLSSVACYDILIIKYWIIG